MTLRLYVPVGGLILHGLMEGGRVGVPLVFINSLGTDLRIWDSVIARITSYPEYALRPLFRYDKRGHGLSDCPPAPYVISDHADDLAELIDHFHFDSVVLIGISVGGMIAIDYASRFPDKVRAMILSDTAASIGTKAGWNERISMLRKQGMHHLGHEILARWFAPAFSQQQPAAYNIYYNMLTRTPVEGYTGTCEAIRDADLNDQARQIKTPVLVLCGAEDQATPPEICRPLADLLGDARFELIEGAGHLPCIEQPGIFAEKLGFFLQNLE